MKRCLIFVCIAISIIINYGCNGTSKFPIDEKAIVDTHNRFLGDWKMEEDPDKKNFIRLEDYSTKFKDSEPYYYHTQIWDRSGTNRTYEFNIFFSEIGKTMFINVVDWTTEDWMRNQKYILLKITEISPDYDKITAMAVSDPNLMYAKDSKDVRMRLTMNVDNPAYYSNTFHFYKVK